MDMRKNIFTVIFTFLFALLALLVVGLVNNFANGFSPVPRLALLIAAWWPMLLVTVFFMRRDKETLKDIGFTKEKIMFQILLGILVAVGSLVIFIVIPALFGFMMGYAGNYDALGVVSNFVYIILSVALVEEIIFRGHLIKKLQDIKSEAWFPVVLSSVLFGLFHIFNWNILQMVITTVMGLYWAVCRLKIRHCTLLSLIIAHALHNTLLPLVTVAMFR